MTDQHSSDDRTVGALGVWRLCCDETHEPCSDETCTCEMCTEWRFIRAEARAEWEVERKLANAATAMLARDFGFDAGGEHSHVVDAALAAKRAHDKAIAAARAEGAREERERCATLVESAGVGFIHVGSVMVEVREEPYVSLADAIRGSRPTNETDRCPPDGYLDRIEDDDSLDDTGAWRAFAFAWGFKRRRCSDMREDMDKHLRAAEAMEARTLKAEAERDEWKATADAAMWHRASDNAGLTIVVANTGPVVIDEKAHAKLTDAALRELYPTHAERLIAERTEPDRGRPTKEE